MSFLALMQLEEDDADNGEYEWSKERLSETEGEQRCHLAKLFDAEKIGRFIVFDLE